MKFFGKSLLFFSCIGLSYFSIEAKSISVLLDHSSKENYRLEALVNDYSPCELVGQQGPFSRYCQKLIIENEGKETVYGCLPTTNEQRLLTLDNLAKILAKEKQPLIALLQIWRKSMALHPSSNNNWSTTTALDYLNFIGSCPPNEYQKQFIQLCHQLGIDTRLASVRGKQVYDFNCHGDDWSFIDVISGQVYLGWDNTTPVSSEAMMDDPLLVLRAKTLRLSDQMDFAKAWQNFAHFEVIDPSLMDDEVTFEQVKCIATSGFDLYPNEKLIYLPSTDDNDSNPYQISVEQILDWQTRHAKTDGTYQSPFPIHQIYNNTDVPLYLKDQQVTLQPNESYSFSDQMIFKIEIQSEDSSSGCIKVISKCAWNLFPVIKSGINTIDLGTGENHSTVKLTFEVDEELENFVQPLVVIHNQADHFEYTAPHFCLNTTAANPATEIWWQISSDAEFKNLSTNLEQKQPFSSEITLSSINETFLNSDDTYYFRVRGCRGGQWSNWSETFAFTVKKPDSVNLIEFDQIDAHEYILDWSREAEASDTPIEYLLFGSNAFDFIPSIYSATQINEIIDGKVIIEERNENLLASTTDTKFIVDGSLAYYRIVARKNGQLSIPSPIIHVYGNDLIQPRTVLQVVEIDQDKFVAKRILFPPSYPWTETALPLLGVNNRLYENSLLHLQAIIMGTSDSSSSFDSRDQGFVRPAHVSHELWERMRPYFLPENHPWKKKIDRIFTKTRASQNPDTIKKAGFKGRVTGVRRIFAGTHPDCIECFFKIYLDSEINTRYIEWQKWIDRIVGKNRVKACIKKYGFEKWFSTPDKWVYPLPEKPLCPKSTRYKPKNFILCCTNQRPYEHSENEKMWKSKLSRQHLDALYILIDEPGMWDSVFPFNIPFCKVDGKMCFVDTEYSHKWPIRFEKLNRYFSKENLNYWEYLIRHNGPKGYESPHPVY